MQLPSLEPADNYESLTAILEDMSFNSGEIQQRVLEEILSKNSNTEYLRSFLGGCENMDDKELFKKKVPLVAYQDIQPYIERIADGEPHQILSEEPITLLLRSSGTTAGKQRFFPTTAEEPARQTFFFGVCYSVINKHIGITHQRKRMQILLVTPEITTPGGLAITNGSTNQLRNLSKLSSYVSSSSPDEVIRCLDTRQSLYLQLLCGLVQRDSVLSVGSGFASGFLRVIEFLRAHWQELCSNIRTGHVSDWIIDPACRQAVSSVLQAPMPNLADLIEKECEETSWEGIIKKLWPRTKCIEAIITGSMAQYLPKLEFYSGGTIPLVSSFYCASEGCFGVNLNPLSDPYNVAYTLVPWMAYYEFLQLDHENCQGEQRREDCNGVVDLANVKIGRHYELVVTTFAGLYRYRVGDVLMVTDIHNNAPQFKFVSRENVVLSIDADKTTEKDLSKAVLKAMDILQPLGFLLTDYTSYADISSTPGHYVLFWELQNVGEALLDAITMEKCCSEVELSLDMLYRKLRNRGNYVGPLEIRVVKEGTFDALMDMSIARGTSFSQYKTPRSIKSEEALRLLNSMVVECFRAK